MRYLDLSLPSAAENLALDEALLYQAESAEGDIDTLRVWEAPNPMVVVGRYSTVREEVHLDACRELGIPVLRRISGGATIVAGPGCLMYALVLDYRACPWLRSAGYTHRRVLSRLVEALSPLMSGVRRCGYSDLAVEDLKFSGNSMKVKPDRLLYHGTLLYNFPLELIDRCLAMPPRQPAYRGSRGHGTFVTNLRLPLVALRPVLMAAWNADRPCRDWPRELTNKLVAEKYSRPEWNDRP